MYKMIFIVFCTIAIAGCSHLPVYRPPIQQGNVVTQKMLNAVKLGMTKAQVEQRLGPPVLQNIFSPNRSLYTYTFQPYSVSAKGSKMTVKQATLIFDKGKLAEIDADNVGQQKRAMS